MGVQEGRSLLQDGRVGVEPLLQAFAGVLRDPAGTASPPLVAGALFRNGTAPACPGGRVAKMAAELSGRQSTGQLRAARTPGAVLIRIHATDRMSVCDIVIEKIRQKQPWGPAVTRNVSHQHPSAGGEEDSTVA
jgi:hypothetical protein